MFFYCQFAGVGEEVSLVYQIIPSALAINPTIKPVLFTHTFLRYVGVKLQ